MQSRNLMRHERAERRRNAVAILQGSFTLVFFEVEKSKGIKTLQSRMAVCGMRARKEAACKLNATAKQYFN